MSFSVGQSVYGSIGFVDGTTPQYNRPYLIVEATENYIEVLNVSSIQGKEHKLAWRSNVRLINYNPPFNHPSFVKVDSLVRVDKSEWGSLKLLRGGAVLNAADLNNVKTRLEEYKQ